MSFQTDKARGDVGEVLFYQAHEGTLHRLDGREGDFQCVSTGEKIELKSDFYPMEKTANFFFERWSNQEAGTVGGPRQALLHGCATFIYLFVPSLTFFKFDTKKLVKALEKIEPTLTPYTVTGGKTVGYRVPRDAVSHLYEEYALSISAKKKASAAR